MTAAFFECFCLERPGITMMKEEIVCVLYSGKNVEWNRGGGGKFCCDIKNSIWYKFQFQSHIKDIMLVI